MLRPRNRAGRFRKRGTIQYLPKSLAANANEFNEPDLTAWKPFLADVWFNLKGITGREIYYGHEIVGDASHLIECRFIAGVTPAMRMAFFDQYQLDPATGKLGKQRFFNFDYVDDLENRHVELYIQCHEPV
jgi:hypothetical protein